MHKRTGGWVLIHIRRLVDCLLIRVKPPILVAFVPTLVRIKTSLVSIVGVLVVSPIVILTVVFHFIVMPAAAASARLTSLQRGWPTFFVVVIPVVSRLFALVIVSRIVLTALSTLPARSGSAGLTVPPIVTHRPVVGHVPTFMFLIVATITKLPAWRRSP